MKKEIFKIRGMHCASCARNIERAVLSFDFNEGRLRNYLADAHNLQGVWGASPILVLDIYEHAYFIDFGTNKKNVY